jgi:hypothetical protein
MFQGNAGEQVQEHLGLDFGKEFETAKKHNNKHE